MSATEEKIAHDKWVRDLKDNKVSVTLAFARCIFKIQDKDIYGFFQPRTKRMNQKERPFKRLQLI